jgi:PKD repeat protein
MDDWTGPAARTRLFGVVLCGALLSSTACGDEGLSEIENRPPEADAGADLTAEVGALITFDGSASSDPDGDDLDFAWDFGDGASSEGEAPSHIYNEGGVYYVKLTVTDAYGASDAAEIAVTVGSDAPPIAVIDAPLTALIGDNVRFDGSASSDDSAVSTWSWEFGDGDDGAGAQVDHVFDAAGSYTVSLVVTDDGGKTGRAEHTIVVEEGATGWTGTWSWFLVDDSQRDLGFTCGSFEDSTLLIDADGAPSLSITEQAGSLSVQYDGTLSGADFDVLRSSLGVEQRITGTFTSATTFEGFYKISPLGQSCPDRAVTGVKQGS